MHGHQCPLVFGVHISTITKQHLHYAHSVVASSQVKRRGLNTNIIGKSFLQCVSFNLYQFISVYVKVKLY